MFGELEGVRQQVFEHLLQALGVGANHFGRKLGIDLDTEFETLAVGDVPEGAGAVVFQFGEPYVAGAAGYTARVELPGGTPAVLKLIYPHREAEHEADALATWDGHGAVKLLARDDDRSAMLLER